MPASRDEFLIDTPDEGPGGTRLENVEDVRRQLAGVSAPPIVPPTVPPVSVPAGGPRLGTVREAPTPPPGPAGVVPYRPMHRPPMALLCVFHDGRDDGEVMPIRTERFVIGRSEGDLVIPHDGMMSGKHAEITRSLVRGQWRWLLADLKSTNGTYVRTAHSILQHESEFLIGGRRYRFEAPPQGADPAAAPGASGPQATRGWQSVTPTQVIPSFVEMSLTGQGPRFFLDRGEHWIGRDGQQCDIVIADDPMLSSRHARLYRDNKGRWVLENAGSLNGVWVRIQRIAVETTGQFQLGEQRFALKVL
jgi:pSer/pThr/pTyr-binding forkhead associated (FHA) protein